MEEDSHNALCIALPLLINRQKKSFFLNFCSSLVCKVCYSIIVLVIIVVAMIFESEKILSHFPPVEFAFAYGSGAIKQGSYDYNRPNG